DGAAAPPGEVWVTGGAQIYAALLPYADVCVVTDIDTDVRGDTVAPALGARWFEAKVSGWKISAKSGLRYRFRTLRRCTGRRGAPAPAPAGGAHTGQPAAAVLPRVRGAERAAALRQAGARRAVRGARRGGRVRGGRMAVRRRGAAGLRSRLGGAPERAAY